MTDLVMDERRSLLRQAEAHHGQVDVYLPRHMLVPKEEAGTEANLTLAAAVLGHCMASEYAYCLAAILGIVAKKVSPQFAEELTLELQRMTADGDFSDHNGDVPAD